MKGVILAGGKGQRLRPLTCNLPKPMLPLLNKPVMEYSLELLKKHGIIEIAITVQYMSAAIRDYFGDGSKWGVKLSYFEDSPPLGTAGSIKQAEAFLDEPFVVISGDALTDINLSRAIDFHFSKDRLVTILLKEVSYPLDFGIAVTNDAGRIIRYIEKPRWNEIVSNTVNSGIYVMNPTIFSHIEPHTFCDFSHDVFPFLLERKEELYGYKVEDYWLDIGDFSQYRRAHFDLLTKKVNVNLPPTEILPTVWMEEGVNIEKGTNIHGPVFIGEGATIQTGAVIEPYSIIGKRSVISRNVHIGKTIVWNDVYIGRQCELKGTTIASGTMVEDGVTLFEKSIIADHCKLGKNTVVKPNVKVWPGKCIESSSVVASSIVAEQEHRSTLFQQGTITGKPNVTITAQWIVKLAAAYGSTLPLHSSIFIGSDHHPYSQLLRQMFVGGIHTAGVHTVACQEVSNPCFRYAIAREQVQGGVFISIHSYASEEIIHIQFYNRDGTVISTRKEKEIEMIYRSETPRYANIRNIGLPTYVSICEEQYVHSVVERIQQALIQQKKFHLLVNKVDGPFHNNIMLFFQLLGCTVTWVYAYANEDHIKSLVQSSRVDMGIMFNEHGNIFELYDSFGNMYTTMKQEQAYIPEVLLHKEACYPLSLKHGASSKICYVEEGSKHLEECFKQDALYRIGNLLEMMASQQLPLTSIFRNDPQLYLLRDEVSCSWKDKGKVMRMLLDDAHDKMVQLLEGIKLEHEDGEWSYIVSDVSQPKLIIYSQSSNLTIAKEKISFLIEKIRQYQKV
ncbi:sugar phosphate nucleotidyltransferase [Microbacteriaceae bacterium 4G12]